jgi:hypothetical protein
MTWKLLRCFDRDVMIGASSSMLNLPMASSPDRSRRFVSPVFVQYFIHSNNRRVADRQYGVAEATTDGTSTAWYLSLSSCLFVCFTLNTVLTPNIIAFSVAGSA